MSVPRAPLIRAATPADAPGIAAVHVQSWRDTYAGLLPADFLARMTSPETQAQRAAFWTGNIAAGQDAVFVAGDAGQIVAFASAGPPRDHPGFDAELFTLYSLKAAQGAGTGRELLRQAAQAMQARGAASLALWVLDTNPTRHWYARRGAHECGEKQDGALRELRMGWSDLTPLMGAPT
ncbi:acetyltransferase [Deinococcus grandis]|uniref:Acetyltransferase n=1 Tax=Deinococcus grandis TaxID=57498 RepID=A0A100HLP9_9DEIO|nr:GNAT family N-acetyltransferase [Deinococcus grandis]BBN93454.1 N-acetyltransferase [Deinococcus grandis]GAQ23035.1 acetyltransferase [Deinococcus grandis]